MICSYTTERWTSLARAVESVLAQEPAPHEVVVVVDHDPALLDRARRRWPELVVIANDGTRGLADARNAGVAAASGDVVAFLDDDAAAAPGWLGALAREYGARDVLGVGGLIEAEWESGRPAWFPPEFDWVVGCSYAGLPGERAPLRNLIGANMSVRRQVIVDAGGFSRSLGRVGSGPAGCEETALCIRARRLRPDGEFLYEPAATVLHTVPAGRSTLRYFVTRCWGEGRSKAQLTQLVGASDGLSSERQYVARTLPAAVVRGLGDAVRGDVRGLARAGATVLGLAATTVAYLRGRAALPRRPGVPRGDRLRLLMVTPRYAPEVGGVERHVEEVARRLAAVGCDVTVLCTDRSGRLPREETRDGVTIRRARALRAAGDLHLAPGIARVIARGDWDVIHVQSYHTLVAPLAMLAARRAGIPYVVTFHGGGHSSRLRTTVRRLQRRLLRPLLVRAERLVAVARFEIETYGRELAMAPGHFRHIPNGVDVVPAVPAAPASAQQPGPLIVSVGRLERYKGHHRVVGALPRVLQAFPDTRLWIAGSGPYESSLRALTRELGVADRVAIEQITERTLFMQRLAGADLVVLLSEFETHPLAVLEAAALGRPVLVADNSGLRELAEAGFARAIATDSSDEAVAAAIVDQLTAPIRPAGVDLPTWDHCARDLLALYEEIAPRSGA